MYAEQGYLLHSEPAMYTLAPQNGKIPSYLLCLPTLPCFPARRRQPSMCQVSTVPPGRPAHGTNALLLPQLLTQRSCLPTAQSKTIEINLQVSIVVTLLLCKLSPVFIFHRFGKCFAFAVQALPNDWAAYRLHLALDLHVKQELRNKKGYY